MRRVAGHVDRNAERLLHGERDVVGIDAVLQVRLGDDALRVGLQIGEDRVHVLVHLDEDAAFALADLHRLVDELARIAAVDDAVHDLDVLGIQPHAAVRSQAADRPGIVGAVDRVEVEVEANAVVAERVVGTRRDDALPRLFHLGVDRVGDDPRGLLVFRLHPELLDGALRILGADADRPRHDGRPLAERGVEREQVDAKLGNVDDQALVARRVRQDAACRQGELDARLRLPLVDARIRVAQLAKAETTRARDVEEVVSGLHAIAAELPDDAGRLGLARHVRGEPGLLHHLVDRRRQLADSRIADVGVLRRDGVLRDGDDALLRRDTADGGAEGHASDETSEGTRRNERAHGRKGQQLRCHGSADVKRGFAA